MTDPLYDAEAEARSLLAAAARLEALEAELAAAHRQLGEWRESVVAANRISQEHAAEADRLKAAVAFADEVIHDEFCGTSVCHGVCLHFRALSRLAPTQDTKKEE
jgi:hypothetical protein